jgi:hypothetical protein
MQRFIVLMHNDTVVAEDGEAWGPYLDHLRSSGRFEGGSSIGDGETHRLSGSAATTSTTVVGYLIIQAESLDDARCAFAGNPTYQAGGTIEIRALIED